VAEGDHVNKITPSWAVTTFIKDLTQAGAVAVNAHGDAFAVNFVA
jgi:hypothetical protein